jgi:hypothetical protein
MTTTHSHESSPGVAAFHVIIASWRPSVPLKSLKLLALCQSLFSHRVDAGCLAQRETGYPRSRGSFGVEDGTGVEAMMADKRLANTPGVATTSSRHRVVVPSVSPLAVSDD